MNSRQSQIRSIALKGAAWSVVQNWGGKIILFLIFIVLARILTPAEFGLASASVAIILVISQISELGYGDAIKQRKNYVPEDSNLPFFISLLFSTVLAISCFIWSDKIESWISVDGMGIVVAVLALSAPLTTLLVFQEVNYSREFQFKRLALRVLISNLIAGAVAIVFAIAGAGVWSLVIQSYITTVVSLVWLWIQPVWIPSLKFRFKSLGEMTQFAWPVVTMRMLDLITQRIFELILIGTFGIAVYGLYAVATRLYSTLNQLLHSALNSISLPILSRVSADTVRLKSIYERTIIVAAMLFAPIYVGFAAMISEVSSVLFNSKWDGVESISGLLLLLGAVQSVQFMNGPYLSSRGRSGLVLFIGSLKSIALGLGLIFFEFDSLNDYIFMYVITQLAGTPVSFFLTAKELEFDIKRLFINLMPAVLGCISAYWAVSLSRVYLDETISLSISNFVLLFFIFIVVYIGVFLALGYRQIEIVISFIKGEGGK